MRIIYYIILTGVLLLQLSCFKKKQSELNLPLKDTFRYIIPTEPPTLDWNKAVDTTSALILNNIMEGLVDYDFSNTISIKPALAKSWTFTADRKVWTFTLKKNVYWSDGKILTAHHVLDGWERLLNPKTASEFAYFLYSVKNARAYNTGKIKDFSQVGIKVNHNNQLVVELEEGKSYFPYLLSNVNTYPIRKDMIQKYGDAWNQPENLVTLGAYRLRKWKHDQFVALERSSSYHGPAPYIKNIMIHIIEENATALHLFEQNKVDVMSNLPSQELAVLKKKKEYREHPILSLYFYGFNVKKKPFDNVLVRQALSRAIDKESIIRLLQGGRTPMTSWIPKGMFGYAPSLGLSFNPQQARLLLDKAGYRDRTKFPTITISYNTNEDHKKVAEHIQAQLKKHLQISVELSSQEWKMYLQNLKTGQQDMYRMGWLADYPDPHNFMELMTSHAASNRTFWKNKMYDKLVQQASTLTNGPVRLSLYNKAQKILVEQEVPVIPIYSAQSYWLVNKRVAFFPLNPIDRIHFQYVRFH